MVPFNPLDYPAVFLEPAIPNFNSAWIEHVPFAFTLIDLLRPATVVELGVHTGASYTSFCRAIKHLELPTRCFGVDTWQGDLHVGEYKPEVLTALQSFHDPKYSEFSTLMKMEFDTAASRFESASIDLLHIDGLHTYEAVRHDFETWLPKMSSKGVVLFHDTVITRDDFGVYKLWAELAERYPNFNFEHGSGLGVLGLGNDIPAGMESLFQASVAHARSIRDFYSRLGREIDLRRFYSSVMHQVFQGHKLINQWKEQMGQDILPDSQNMQLALDSGVTFTRSLVMEIHRLATLDLTYRLEMRDGAKQV